MAGGTPRAAVHCREPPRYRQQAIELSGKRLGILREVAPQATRFIALVDPAFASTPGLVTDVQARAAELDLPVEFLQASTAAEIDAAFVQLTQERGSALLVSPKAFFTARRAQIVTQAARRAIPAIYPVREFADSGGLVSYGPNVATVYQRVGAYAARILKGEKSAELPVEQPTKFELIINLITARALDIMIPFTLLALADEVID
jgi:putative tryptophan/tyrosine transport system substrate-binding protein